jgi:hypothetical protein
MDNTRPDWPVSQTGGAKIAGTDAAKILRVSKAQLYVLIERGDLQRAEARRKNVRSQPLVFFLEDIIRLALSYETITPEQASEMRAHPNQATASIVA